DPARRFGPGADRRGDSKISRPRAAVRQEPVVHPRGPGPGRVLWKITVVRGTREPEAGSVRRSRLDESRRAIAGRTPVTLGGREGVLLRAAAVARPSSRCAQRGTSPRGDVRPRGTRSSDGGGQAGRDRGGECPGLPADPQLEGPARQGKPLPGGR